MATRKLAFLFITTIAAIADCNAHDTFKFLNAAKECLSVASPQVCLKGKFIEFCEVGHSGEWIQTLCDCVDPG